MLQFEQDNSEEEKGLILQNPRFKLLVIDVDGTLINKYGEISPENCEALDMVRALGLKVSLSTGRSPQSSRRFIEKFSLDGYHIFFDGAMVSHFHTGEIVYAQAVARELVEKVSLFAQDHDIYLELYSPTHCFASYENWWTDADSSFFGIEPQIGDLAGIWEQEDIMKGQLVMKSSDEKALAENLCRHFAGSLEFSEVKSPTYPDATFINILAPGVSKGKALEALALRQRIPPDKVVAIGDWINDIPLLQKAGLGIAMGNAHNELKKVADYVTLDVEEHGLTAAIEKFLL